MFILFVLIGIVAIVVLSRTYTSRVSTFNCAKDLADKAPLGLSKEEFMVWVDKELKKS